MNIPVIFPLHHYRTGWVIYLFILFINLTKSSSHRTFPAEAESSTMMSNSGSWIWKNTDWDEAEVRGYVNPGSICRPPLPLGVNLTPLWSSLSGERAWSSCHTYLHRFNALSHHSSYTLHFTGLLIRPATNTHTIDLLFGWAWGPALKSCINHRKDPGMFRANGVLLKCGNEPHFITLHIF